MKVIFSDIVLKDENKYYLLEYELYGAGSFMLRVTTWSRKINKGFGIDAEGYYHINTAYAAATAPFDHFGWITEPQGINYIPPEVRVICEQHLVRLNKLKAFA